MLLENDLTRNPQPFIIVAGVRTGGTLLTHGLDSHPLIHCARGEPWHKRSEWWQLGLTREQLLKLLVNQTGYMASGFKVQSVQLSDPEVCRLLQESEAYIILLSREDTFRQTISELINYKVRRNVTKFVPKHSFEAVPMHSVVLDPEVVQLRQVVLQYTQELAEQVVESLGLRYISLTYEQLVAGEQEISKLPSSVTKRLCNYLGVPIRTLSVFLRRVNWQPLDEIIGNLKELEKACC